MAEPDFKASPEQIARITETAIRKLAETHVILTKDDLRKMISDAMETHTKDLWDLILSSYQQTVVQMTEVLTADQLQGFKLGENLLERMHSVVLEEHSGLFDANHPEN